MKLFEAIVLLAIGVAEGMRINDWRHIKQELIDIQFEVGNKKKSLVEKAK